MSAPSPRQRADVWLFRARLFKSRALATKCVDSGAVRLERDGRVTRLERAATPVQPGDMLVIGQRAGVLRLRIIALGERRGPTVEARALYETLGEASHD